MLAAKAGHVEVVPRLARARIRHFCPHRIGAAYFFLLKTNNEKGVRNSRNVFWRCQDGSTAMNYAARGGNLAVMSKLEELGLDPTIANEVNNSKRI